MKTAAFIFGVLFLWSWQPASAQIMCLGLSDPANGTISFSQGVMVGSMATYTCHYPFILSENNNQTCEASAVGAVWSGSQPTCTFPDFNNATIRFERSNYTVMENGSVEVCIAVYSGFVGSPFNIWYHRRFFGITIWFHITLPYGLVTGDIACSDLSVANDDLLGNNMTITVPLEIPENVTGVTAESNTTFSLFFIDNDGPDVDECAMGIDNCDSNAECMNTDGSFNCTCNPGYTGDGLLCSDIDECATNTDNCNENALCTDVEGSFECVCNTGFNGDGVSCAIPATVDAVSFYFNYYDVYVYFYLSNLVENPFLNNGDFNRQFDRTSDVPCFLNELVFRNTNTNETFQADYPGFCSSYSNNFIFIRMNHRDYLKLVLDGFISTTSTTPLEMYTADMLGAPFNLHIEPNDAIEFNVIMNFYSYVGITDLDYWIDEGILLIHFRTLIDVATVNPSKLSLFRNYDRSNAVSITGGEVLNQSPGLARSVAIRLTSDDLDILACRGICTGNDLIFNQACYLGVESEFATGYFGVEVSPTTGYRVNNIRRAPTDFEPVTMSIQLEYIDGLIFNLTLGLGQPFTVRYDVGERIISVMCTSRNTSHMNPMLDIDNGAVSIPPNYIQNDWPNSTTLNAPWGLAESGLQGYHTCRTEGDTFLSHMHHLLHPNGNYIFFYNDTSISVDIYEDIVLRFAHSGNFEFNWFQLFTNEYNRAPFNFRFEINTPFPYHAELHIARTRFNYAGEYFIYYNSHLWPNIIIDVNALKLTLYPPVLTVLSSDPPDTTASLTCTSSNSNVPVMFPGNHTSLGITSTYLDDTKTSVRLDFELNESLIGMLEGMKFICEARDPDNFNSIVSTASSTFRKVSAPLSIYAIEPDSSRNQVMDGAMINTASSFECLWYINSTQTDIEVITETLFWRINLESQEEMEFTSDVSVEDYIVTTLENGITLNILGSFRGNVSCIYGNDSLRVNVVTRAPVSGVDFIPPIFPEDAVELFDSDDGCSQRIYSSTGIPFGAATHQYVHVCTNGMLTVGTPPLFLGTASERFPTSDIRISQSNLLAPFWNDHDNRDFTSSVRYRVYNDAGGDTDSFINIVSSFISNRIDAEIFGTFVPTWMLVASWRDVPPYPYTAIDRGKNSFEAIIITDGVVTFAVYTYNCDDLQWGQSQDGDYSTIGYNINPASFFGSDPQNLSAFQDHRISNLPMSEMVACSSLVRGSRYHNEVYLVGQSRDTTQLARAECTSSINNDTLYGNIIIRSTVRDGCPCNLAQASRDFAFSFIGVFQLTLDPVYADQFCYTPRFSQINTILCCYSQNSGALNNVGGISGVVAYSPSFFPREFLDNDYNLRRKCSIGGAIDTLYRTRRPPVTCAIYQPPRRTFCSGDPHLTNLDGTKFTFNGWGEYILLELETDNTTFWVQARMHPLVDSNATELGGFAFAMSRDTPVEIRLNATRQLDILISGEDVTDQLVNVSSSISTDFYSVSRSSSNSILATFPNGMGLMVTLSSMLTFTVIIPDAFRGLTRGMVGNYNGDVTDDVRFRNGTLVPLSEFSFRILHQVGLSWQLDASESLFTYPEGLTAADFAVLDHDPPYLDEVVASASAEVLQACGNNVECIFDSMETGDINIGLETMAMISIIDEDERLASNFPPMINGPDTLYVTLGEQAELVFNVTDDKGIINVTLVDGLPAGATLLPAPIDNFTVEYTLKLQLDTIFDISLVFLATDELDSGSTLEVQVVICACVNNGNCTLEGVVDQSASTVVSNCLCPQGWEGDFCEDDVDGCANFDCFMSVNCVDVPAPGVGAMCGPCPQGYRGDGSKCADINECNGTHGCAQLCVNEPGSFECACYPGYELVSQAECRDINECSLLNGGCHHFCNNTIGGFDCSCEEGYTISIDNETCQVDPISMCDAMSSCAQSCVSLSGVETCNCLPGFELASNQIDCTNINECLEDPCEQICVDLAGGYECSCREGYELLPGGRCTDINECLVAAMDISTPDLCGPLMFCVNGDGNYSCECLAGTLLMDGVCEAVMCLDLIDPANGTISFSQGVMVGSVATYTCNDPYILSENSNPICEPSAVGAMWSGSQPTCNFPDFNSVTISFERSDYTVIENGSVEVCIAVDSGFVGSPFNIWYHENLFGITIWFHITLPYGLVTGDTECSDLSVTNDDLLGNNMTITVPLEIPENVTGVTAESNTTFSLLFIDNDGPDVDECAMGIDNCDSNAECMNTEGSFNCTCNPGYTGDGLLCNDIDECATNTNSCNANTVCTNGEGSFECMCDTGFSGDGVSCANIDECASLHNCHDNALCTDTMGSFNCVCDDGYRGDGVACIDIDECDDNMDNCTEDNAECTNTIGSFTCACDPGYSGDGTVCTDIDECATNMDNCGDNTVCINVEGSFNCMCDTGFVGDGVFCANINECAIDMDNCNNNALCTDTMGSFTCVCTDGFRGNGVACTDIDECDENLDNCAEDNAECTNTIGSFTCTCDPGYSGDGTVCMEIDECATNTDNCDDNALCTDVVGSFECVCNTGFSGDGVSCANIDECGINMGNCDDNALCTDTMGSFTCVCADGFLGDGVTCTDIDECTGNMDNCAEDNAECTNTIGSFTCACDPGYSGDGTVCMDIDECATNTDNCNDNALCTDVEGSFECMCNTGFNGDGVSCANIDECALSILHNCHDNALCTDTMGSFICVCVDGFRGDGVACVDIEECDDNLDNCAEDNAECTNTIGSFTCACDPGYSGDGTECMDIDECDDNLDNCAEDNAKCANTIGSFTCACDPGYSGDGTVCTDIDECATNTDNCNENALCTDVEGSFECVCNTGFSGDGVSCANINECAIDMDNCNDNALCTDTMGSFICGCVDGFRGDGVTCTDIDECDEILDNCAEDNAECTNTIGSFTCACDPGYSGDGTVCMDTDECAAGLDNCHPNATCSNSVGSFSCDCYDDFFGDGNICIPGVQLSLAPDRYSVLEGESLDVTMNVYNPSDENITVSGCFHILKIELYVSYSFDVHAGAMFAQTETIMFPGDDILNDMEKMNVELVLESDSDLVTIVDGYGTANVIVVDDDIVDVGFTETEVYVLESEGVVHVCVELLQGSGCQRPLVLRVNTRKHSDATFPANKSDDFKTLREVGSININAEEGQTECFDVNIVNDDYYEQNETFKIMLDVKDANVFTLVDMVIVTIIDDDIAPIFCPELSIENGEVTVMGEQTPGTTAHYSCDEFYILNGNTYRTCQENGTWTGEDPECERGPFTASCLSSMDSITGPLIINCSTVGPAVIVNISCDFDNSARVEECTSLLSINFLDFDAGIHTLVITFTDADGIAVQSSFSFSVPFVCPSLSIGNGDVDIMGRMFKIGYLAGAIANYSCDNFFILAGNEFRNCQADGTWDGMDPECERGPIMLDCTSSQTSPAVLPDLSCTAVGPFSIVNTICNFDDGAYNITECDLAAPLKSPVVGQLGAGNHTLLITVSDSDGEMAKFIFNFFIPPPLGLACVEVEFNPFLYRLMCTADNSLSKPLLCEAASSLGSFTVDCGQLDVVNTIDAPPLLGDVAYTLTVSAVDIFEQQESDVLMFILPGPPTLELQFNNNTPDVDGSDIRVSFVSNNPLESAVCAINGPNPISRSCDLAMDGFSGSFVFSPVNRVTARYITITAMSANSQTGSLIRGVRSGAIAQCSAHLINEGVVISGNSVTVEFTITGLANLASSICILGSQVVDPCTSPVTFDNVIQAEFQGGLVIRPNDPDRLCSRTISRLVTLV
ncbi:uncharacterized protein LOC135334155 isoform X5 [Halichondria panicea]|uniref:uncharacterized protein LOC135334155 isoform X5 n=1 Tax=Halichondria panicea TaxID=6063 RepID=UPI00312B8206